MNVIPVFLLLGGVLFVWAAIKGEKNPVNLIRQLFEMGKDK